MVSLAHMQPTKNSDLAAIIDASNRLPRTRRNFRMQYRLAVHTLIPWLEQLQALPPSKNMAVCEIGCGEGGVIAAFVERGAEYALGTDIVGPLLEQVSQPLAKELNLNTVFTTHDVIGDSIPPEWEHRFDVVVLRDVIEHLDNQAAAMQSISRIIKPGGNILITFPPYTSAFGGHQQLLGTTLGGIPFIHLLPSGWFEHIIKKGDSVNQDEVRRLHKIRSSVRGVKEAAAKAGLVLKAERYFGLRPVFKWKYNMPIPTLELTAIKWFKPVTTLAMEAALVFTLPK